MKVFMCPNCNFWCCHVLMQLFLTSIVYENVSSKCTVNKQDVICFGSTWKQDLLPIENSSLMKLYISKCTEFQTQSGTLDINFLRNVSKLKLLSITDCALSRLPVTNYVINSIEIMDLSNNQIDANVQFSDTLKRFPNLKVLNLANNRLTHLPKHWFDCPSQIEMIILDGNLIAGLNPSLAACFVKLKHLSLKGNQFERLRMPSDKGKPSTGAYIKDTGGLRLFVNQGGLIRQGHKKSATKSDKVSRSRHDYPGVIPQFKTLTSLDLSHNKIKSIDQIPLSQLESLNRLNLSYNHLSSKAASGLKQNECDFGTAPFFVNGKLGLIDLDLSSNLGLTRIHNCWTFGLQNLQNLRIRNCSISSIYDSSFDKMKSLTFLDLSNNKLSSVPKELMVVTKSLKWLSLSYNNISQMTSFYLSTLENLQNLNLSHNQFQNLMSFPPAESDGKLSDNFGDFIANNRDSNSEEPINLLGQMKQLHQLDLSFNDLLKVSAISDLSPSIRADGELQRIDVRGNPSLVQFTYFNANEITTFLTEFLIDSNLKLKCDCLLVGFIKWINQRHIDVSGHCSAPQHLSHFSINGPQLINSILIDQSCKDISPTVPIKPPYRLKLSSNANLSLDASQSDNDPMDDGQKKSANQKRQVDYQKWIMTGNNLTLRCQFYSTYPMDVPINIEWQRLKQKPIDNKQQSQQIGNLFLKEEKSERFDGIKYHEKMEQLSSNYDPRIKITQIGPTDEETVADKLSNSEDTKNMSPKHTYKYIGFLVLKPVYRNDIGRYRCLINGLPAAYLYGQNQLISKEENINVFTPPRFTSTPSNPMAIIEGETAEITCRAVGTPLPMTSLGRIGSKDFPAARGRRMKMYKDDSSFFITNISHIDAGNYSCTSRNVAGTIVHNFTLKVQMPATILNKVQQAQTVTIGQALIIDYKVKGVPMPRVKWFKDDRRIVENDRIRFSSDHLMLIVQSTVLSDAGIYKISVLNALGGNDAFVSVAIRKSDGQIHRGASPIVTEISQSTNHDKDLTRMPDYWLGGILIIVILSILITSILWITIFFCFSKIIGSKKRRLLLISNSQSRCSIEKTLNTTTTNFSNPRIVTTPLFKPLGNCSIPLSLTSSTIVPRDHGQENIDIDTFTDSTQSATEFYSPQLFRNCVPYGNNRFLSQPYLSSSGMDLTNKLSQSTSSTRNHHQNRVTDPCDSGIDSSHVYSETLNSSEMPNSIYQCRHKSKHRNNHQKQRKRYTCSNSSDNVEAVRSKKEENNNGDGGSRKRIEDLKEDRVNEGVAMQFEITNEPNCVHDQDCYRHTNHNTRQCTTPLIADHSQYTSQ